MAFEGVRDGRGRDEGWTLALMEMLTDPMLRQWVPAWLVEQYERQNPFFRKVLTALQEAIKSAEYRLDEVGVRITRSLGVHDCIDDEIYDQSIFMPEQPSSCLEGIRFEHAKRSSLVSHDAEGGCFSRRQRKGKPAPLRGGVGGSTGGTTTSSPLITRWMLSWNC